MSATIRELRQDIEALQEELRGLRSRSSQATGGGGGGTRFMFVTGTAEDVLSAKIAKPSDPDDQTAYPWDVVGDAVEVLPWPHRAVSDYDKVVIADEDNPVAAEIPLLAMMVRGKWRLAPAGILPRVDEPDPDDVWGGC